MHSSQFCIYTFSIEEHPYLLEATVIEMNKDVIITVGGGSFYHIGAVAVGFAHPSIKSQDKTTSTVSLITIPGHKEDLIVQNAAKTLSRLLNSSVVITAGLHIDNASENDIEVIVKNFYELINQIEDFFIHTRSLSVNNL